LHEPQELAHSLQGGREGGREGGRRRGGKGRGERGRERKGGMEEEDSRYFNHVLPIQFHSLHLSLSSVSESSSHAC